MKKFYFLVLCLLATSGLWAQTQILAPLPAQSTTFTGNVRGYWFTAPTCFTITGVEVPTTASSAAQSVAVVRFQANPPLFSATTNVFTTLLLAQNSAVSGIIPCNIQVEQGDVIGILGSRGGVNSYATANYVSSIEGLPVTFARLGMQFPLATTAPTQLWTESSGSLSRVNLYYDSLLTYNITATPSGPSSYTFSDGSDSSFTSVWDYGDGSPLDNVWQGSHTYAVGGTYTVCSYITTSCGTDTVCTNVTVCGAGPTTNFGYFGGAGLSPQFNDLSTGGATSWAWDFGDGNTSTAQNPSHTYAAPGNYNVCLITTDGCAQSDTLCQSFNFCNLPVASFTHTGGVNQAFTNNSTNGASYLWSFGDGSFDTTASPTHTYNYGYYLACLTVTNGCGESDTICDSVVTCVTPISSWNYSTVGNDTYVFGNSSSDATDYWWDFGDGNWDTTANPTHVYTASGAYTVCLTAYNDCRADTVCNIVYVCLSPLPNSIILTTNQYAVTCTTNTGPWSYHWDFGDGATSNTQASTHTYAQNGTYNVCCTISDSCGSSVTLCDTVVINVVGVANVLPGFEISLAPNPMSQRTTLMVTTAGLPGAYTLELLDMRGALVLTREGQVNVPLTLDKASLAAGIYSFRVVQGGNALGSGKLIVE